MVEEHFVVLVEKVVEDDLDKVATERLPMPVLGRSWMAGRMVAVASAASRFAAGVTVVETVATSVSIESGWS